MPPAPAPRDPGRDALRRVPPWPDWMDDPAYLASRAEGEDPGDLEDHEDPGDWLLPVSAEPYPGESTNPAAGFAAGQPLDAAPGCPALGLAAEDAAGDDDRYAGATDEELIGAICAWDRVESNASARKHAAVGELIRRRATPEGWDEFTARELNAALHLSLVGAEQVLDLANALEVRLPGTKAAFRSGQVTQYKVQIIARATALLNPKEARAAEAKVLRRAGTLTPPGLRAAISRAVMEVNHKKAKQRREHMARRTRVECWPEDSGNASLAGRELPPAEVLAADQRVTAWAQELRRAGLDGDMDTLRARAFLDILLGTDSRPPATSPGAMQEPSATSPGATHEPPASPGPRAPQTPVPASPPEPRAAAPAGPLAGMIPPGFAARTTMTIPATTLLDRADRPGEVARMGPIDPDLARDLAAAAARSPRSSWCVTVTDSQGHAIGHGCARPAPATSRNNPNKPGPPGCGPGPPRGPWFTLTPAGQPGPPGGYGTWRFSTGIPGQRDLLIAIGPLPAGDCDHRHQASGHDPGVLLRHLAEVRHARCTGPGCRRPAATCDFEHNTPYEAGGRTCLCNGNPKCRYDHRLKQDPRWNAEQLPDGSVRWTTPSGRQYLTEPTRYPI